MPYCIDNLYDGNLKDRGRVFFHILKSIGLPIL